MEQSSKLRYKGANDVVQLEHDCDLEPLGDLGADALMPDPPAMAPEESQAESVFNLGSGLSVHGQKHIWDNVSGDVLDKLQHFKPLKVPCLHVWSARAPAWVESEFRRACREGAAPAASCAQEKIRHVSNVLYLRCYRERLVNGLFEGSEDKHLMSFWPAGQLIHWRWSSLVNVCEGLLEREKAIRRAWNLRRFLDSGAGEPDDPATEVEEGQDAPRRQAKDTGKIWAQFDEAVGDPWFWAYVRFLALVDGQINKISTWMEACACHGWKKKNCPMKGRRCAELASGEFAAFLRNSLAKTQNAFMVCAADLQSARDRATLQGEFQIATDLILTESAIKTSHWLHIPYLLAGLASSDAQQARDIGRRCMEQFDNSLRQSSPEMRQLVLAQHHPLSRRFLDRNFKSRRHGEALPFPQFPA